MESNKAYSALFIAILAILVFLRPSDYVIRKEVAKKIFECNLVKSKGKNLDAETKRFEAGMTWLSIGGLLEIRDFLVFKYYILHTDSLEEGPSGFAVFNTVSTNMIDCNTLGSLSETSFIEKPDQLLPKPLDENKPVLDTTYRAVVDTVIQTLNQKENYNILTGTWVGNQDSYNAIAVSGEQMVVNGNPVRIPACDWKFVIDSKGHITVTQESTEDHTMAFYSGIIENDFQVSGDIAQTGVTLVAADHKSTLDLTFRFGKSNNAALCMPGFRNGPNFEILKR
jgi:hypothetical protein